MIYANLLMSKIIKSLPTSGDQVIFMTISICGGNVIVIVSLVYSTAMLWVY